MYICVKSKTVWRLYIPPHHAAPGALLFTLNITQLLRKRHALRLLAIAGASPGNIHISRITLALIIVFAVLCLTVNVNRRSRASYCISRPLLRALLEAGTTGILTNLCIRPSNLNITSGTIHRIVIHAILRRTY
jgi:hypothetical protein